MAFRRIDVQNVRKEIRKALSVQVLYSKLERVKEASKIGKANKERSRCGCLDRGCKGAPKRNNPPRIIGRVSIGFSVPQLANLCAQRARERERERELEESRFPKTSRTFSFSPSPSADSAR
jgi:hypothetical protein